MGNGEAILGALISLLILFLIIWILKKFSQKVNIFIRDTMKEKQSDGYWKWSKGAIILITAWATCEFMCFYDLFKTGFRMEIAVLMACIATGVPVTSAAAKYINPLVQPPKEGNSNKTEDDNK